MYYVLHHTLKMSHTGIKHYIHLEVISSLRYRAERTALQTPASIVDESAKKPAKNNFYMVC